MNARKYTHTHTHRISKINSINKVLKGNMAQNHPYNNYINLELS